MGIASGNLNENCRSSSRSGVRSDNMTNLGHVVNQLRQGCSGTRLLHYSWISANPRFRGEVSKGGTFICAIRSLSVFTLEVAKFSLILGGVVDI